MIRVTQKENHNHIGFGGNEVILSGPPHFLRGTMLLKNSTDEHVFVRGIPMKNENNASGIFPVHTTLKPREVISKNVHYKMSPQTPPGTYEIRIKAGGKMKKAKVIVHENLDIRLSPQHIVLEGINPGMQHIREILFINNGNIAVTVPNVKHNTLTDMDLICRNLSRAVRSNGDEGIEKTLDAFTKGLKKDIADWVNISIQEAGQVIKPGQTVLLHLTIELPADVNKNYQYSGDIRIFDKEIHYIAIDKAAADVIS